MNQEDTTMLLLAEIGISITPHVNAEHGWGWSIQNDKIIRNWEGPYANPTAAMNAGLHWLLEYARKGLLCHHTHPVIEDNHPLAPWERFFEQLDWDALPE